jgi:hypothetical protein
LLRRGQTLNQNSIENIQLLQLGEYIPIRFLCTKCMNLTYNTPFRKGENHCLPLF